MIFNHVMNNIKKPNIDTFKYAKKLLESSNIVSFPTETVYWLWANALDKDALEKIFKLKNRPAKNPLIVHVWDKKEITKYWIISNPIEKKIIDELMPWPITILLNKKQNIPSLVSSNSYVGIRIPSNKIALDFLNHCKLPIAAPSANISTKPSSTSAKMVHDYFLDNLPLIIDWWNCHVGIESTVLKVDESFSCNPIWKDDCSVFYKITIMRPWFVTKEDLDSLFKNNKNILVEYSDKISNISPWNMYKHYSPDAHIQIINKLDQIDNYLKIDNEKIAIMLTEETIKENKNKLNKLSKNIKIISWWSKKDLIICAQKLFSIYYDCDKEWIDLILVEQLEEQWIGFSIMNRVKKSVER